MKNVCNNGEQYANFLRPKSLFGPICAFLITRIADLDILNGGCSNVQFLGNTVRTFVSLSRILLLLYVVKKRSNIFY